MRGLNESRTQRLLFANYLNFMLSARENYAHEIHAAFLMPQDSNLRYAILQA